MRQKIQTYKVEIRKQSIHSMFKQRRVEMQHQLKAQIGKIEQEEQKSNALDLLNQQYEELVKVMKVGEYERVITSLDNILFCLKGGKSGTKAKVRQSFINSNFIFVIIQVAKNAFQDIPKSGLLQNISKTSISILQLAIIHIDEENGSTQFQGMELNQLLRLSMSEPMLDSKHMTKILDIYITLFSANILNLSQLVRAGEFSLDGPIFTIQKLSLPPNNKLLLSFVTLLGIIFTQNQKQIQLNSSVKGPKTESVDKYMNKFQKDLCFDVARRGFEAFSETDFQSKAIIQILIEHIEVMRLMIQQQTIKLKKHNIKFGEMIGFLRTTSCPFEVKQQIIIIIDDIIYKDEKAYTESFIQQFNLIHVLWGLPQQFRKFVINIFSNIASEPDFKQAIRGLLHNIILMLTYHCSRPSMLTFVYNWFNSQDFEFIFSTDSLLIQAMKNEQYCLEPTQLQCLIWRRLAENGYTNIPQTILSANDYQIMCVLQSHRDSDSL